MRRNHLRTECLLWALICEPVDNWNEFRMELSGQLCFRATLGKPLVTCDDCKMTARWRNHRHPKQLPAMTPSSILLGLLSVILLLPQTSFCKKGQGEVFLTSICTSSICIQMGFEFFPASLTDNQSSCLNFCYFFKFQDVDCRKKDRTAKTMPRVSWRLDLACPSRKHILHQNG